MFKLMRLECKKFKFHFVSIGTILANLGLLLMLFFIGYVGRVEHDTMCKSPQEWMVAINLFSMVMFIIYGGTVTSRLIISEYRTKTIQLMFMYPINRKKLLLCKTLMVYMFTALNLLLSNIVIVVCTCIADRFIDLVPGEFTLQVVLSTLPFTLICIVSGGFLAIVPLYFGMRKKSTAHTIIAAVIVAVFTSSGMGSMAMSAYFVRIIVTGCVAVVSFVLTMRYTLNKTDSIEA